MAYVLLINDLSIPQQKYIAESMEDASTILNQFFKTWKAAADSELFLDFIIFDSNIWIWIPAPQYTMHDYTKNFTRDQLQYIHELLNKTTQSCTDFFDNELIELSMANSPCVGDICSDALLLGCAAQREDVCTLSLGTHELWNGDQIILSWNFFQDDNNTQTKLPAIIKNLAEPAHVDMLLAMINSYQLPVSCALWKEKIGTTIIRDKFWDWFVDLPAEIQHMVLKKVEFCQNNRWMARKDGIFVQLSGTKCILQEIRIWAHEKCLRIYTSRESDTRVVLLVGADKSQQKRAIKNAENEYKSYSRQKH